MIIATATIQKRNIIEREKSNVAVKTRKSFRTYSNSLSSNAGFTRLLLVIALLMTKMNNLLFRLRKVRFYVVKFSTFKRFVVELITVLSLSLFFELA